MPCPSLAHVVVPQVLRFYVQLVASRPLPDCTIEHPNCASVRLTDGEQKQAPLLTYTQTSWFWW